MNENNEQKPNITNVRRAGDGTIAEVKLSNGTEMTIDDAIELAKTQGLSGVVVGSNRQGGATLHGVADGDPTNNLANLPTF